MILDAVGDLVNILMEYDGLCDSNDEETPVEENLNSKTPATCLEEDGEEADGEWITFLNPTTGITLRLPRHTEEKSIERCRGTGAWISKDDLSHMRREGEEKWRGLGAWTWEDDLRHMREKVEEKW